MTKKTIDGQLYSRMLEGGAKLLALHAGEINDLNVFPIPDGDTGENMLLTLQGGADLVTDGDDVSETASKISNAMLLSARGNSGVILSQFFAGISDGLKNVKEADTAAMGEAFRHGVRFAYQSVIKPTEGTILTVIREATEYACIKGTESPVAFFDAFLEEARRSLNRTPELLPILKKAGVVDSGAAGLIYIIEGMRYALTGEEIEGGSLFVKKNEPTLDLDAFGEDSVLEFGYCTELLLRLQNAKTDIAAFEVGKIISYLETVGDSIVAVKSESIVKIHVHTMTPDKVLSFCQQYGEFLKVKIENMSLQHNNINGEEDRSEKKEHKPYGVVAVANGEGIKEAFLGMGADIIVDGGQSMNPSTEDFLRAFDEACADTVFVFPNNSNIILAAKQAASLYPHSDVRVLESKTIGEGYAALSMLDTEIGDVDEIAENCNMAMEGVLTAEISKCVRNAKMDGVEAHTGDYIGFMGKELLASAADRRDAAFATVDKLGLANRDVCILICGEDSTAEEAREIEAYIHSKYRSVEVYTVDGGQAIYSYIIVAE
ncbi:MAG: DAK2 domain-containing protein [Ruminococcaceae bacterium]|nr:DAK2 domain-containing protein [Oscillospiraceae bacterium]